MESGESLWFCMNGGSISLKEKDSSPSPHALQHLELYYYSVVVLVVILVVLVVPILVQILFSITLIVTLDEWKDSFFSFCFVTSGTVLLLKH